MPRQYSLQDWFLRIEFVRAQLDGTTVTEVLDDGTACEDRIVLVDDRKISAEDLRHVLIHECTHAVTQMMLRRGHNPAR